MFFSSYKETLLNRESSSNSFWHKITASKYNGILAPAGDQVNDDQVRSCHFFYSYLKFCANNSNSFSQQVIKAECKLRNASRLYAK